GRAPSAAAGRRACSRRRECAGGAAHRPIRSWWRRGARRCSCSLSSCRIAGIVVACFDLQILAALEAVGIESGQQGRALAAVEPAGEKLANQGPQKKTAAVAAIGLDE